jgi:MYXO-CTERM domain-containing protein
VNAPTQFTAASAHGVRFFHDDATNVCDHDLALIELSTPLDAYPLAHLDLDTELTTGQPLTVIGWGVVADGGMPSVRQARGGIPILAVGPAVQALGYDVPGNEFAVGESICDGDSGGPALDVAGAIVGIVSSGGNGVSSMSTNAAVTCLGPDTVNLYTATSAFRDVILDAFTSVGATPMLVSIPMGESCMSANECTSGLCAAVEADAGTICTEDCASAACPGGFQCTVTGGKSLCASAPSSGCAVAPNGAPWGSCFAVGLALVGLSGARRRRRPRAS